MPKVYTDLDTILDTRAGAILASHTTNEALALTALLKGAYRDRQWDNFTELSPLIKTTAEEVRELQLSGDLDTLQGSIMTNVAFMIKQLVDVNEERNETLPGIENITIEVNTLEYQLSDEERNELERTLKTIMKADVRLVKIPMDFLSINYINQEYDIMLMYYFNEWVESLESQLNEGHKAPGVNIIAPAIYNTTTTSDDIVKLDKEDGIQAFRATEMIFSGVFKLDLIDVSNFCFYVPEA